MFGSLASLTTFIVPLDSLHQLLHLSHSTVRAAPVAVPFEPPFVTVLEPVNGNAIPTVSELSLKPTAALVCSHLLSAQSVPKSNPSPPCTEATESPPPKAVKSAIDACVLSAK